MRARVTQRNKIFMNRSFVIHACTPCYAHCTHKIPRRKWTKPPPQPINAATIDGALIGSGRNAAPSRRCYIRLCGRRPTTTINLSRRTEVFINKKYPSTAQILPPNRRRKKKLFLSHKETMIVQPAQGCRWHEIIILQPHQACLKPNPPLFVQTTPPI